MDYTLNIVSICRFSLYLNIHSLQTSRGKVFIGSWKVLDFLVSKRVRTLQTSDLVGREGCSKRIIYYPDIRLPDTKLSGWISRYQYGFVSGV